MYSFCNIRPSTAVCDGCLIALRRRERRIVNKRKVCHGPEESNKTVQNIKKCPCVLWLIVLPTYCFISVIASERITGIGEKPLKKKTYFLVRYV